MKQILGWSILAIVVLMIILLVMRMISMDKNEGTLLGTYLPNGKVKKKGLGVYLILTLLCIMITVLYVKM